MTIDSAITDLLSAPLDSDWTVDGLAERVLDAIASQPPGSEREFVIDGDHTMDRQVRRLIRPLLACLATKSANEAGSTVNLYGGHLSFQRPGPAGPVWVVGHFENRPGRPFAAMRRVGSPPATKSQLVTPGSLIRDEVVGDLAAPVMHLPIIGE